jgi:hypothetical protein
MQPLFRVTNIIIQTRFNNKIRQNTPKHEKSANETRYHKYAKHELMQKTAIRFINKRNEIK